MTVEPRLADRVLSEICYVPHIEADRIVGEANAAEDGEVLEVFGRMVFQRAIEDGIGEKSLIFRAGNLIIEGQETAPDDEIKEAWRALGMLGIFRTSRIGSTALSRQASWNSYLLRNSMALYFPTAEDNEFWGAQNG